MPTREKKTMNIKLGVVILLIVAILFTSTYTIVQVVQIMNSRPAATGSGGAPNSAGGAVVASGNAGIVVENGLFNVEITLPVSLVPALTDLQTAEEYLAMLKLQDEVKSAQVNGDGTLSFTVTKNYYKTLAEASRARVATILTNYVQSEENQSIQEVSYTSDMSVFTVKVTRRNFELAGEDAFAEPIGINAMYYQAMAGNENPAVKIVFVDASTGEELQSVVYPDALG